MDTSFISNRRVASQPLIRLDAPRGTLAGYWYVSDRKDGADHEPAAGEPLEYSNPDQTFRVSLGYGYWVVANDRGQWLRTRRRKDGRKANPRQFRTPLAAAIVAENLIGDENFQ